MKRKPKQPQELLHHFEAVFRPLRLATKCRTTNYQYELTLRRFDEYLDRPALLSDLCDMTVSKAIAWLRSQGKAPGSVEKFRDNLVCISRVLFRKRVVETELEIEPIHVPIAIPIAWTQAELNRLWEYLELLPGDIDGIPANHWWQSLVCAFWDSGARKSEIFGLRWENVNLSTGFIICKAETVKANKADNLYRLAPETIALLRKIMLPERELVWPWTKNETSLYNTYRMILKRAGLRVGRKFMFHCLRKSVATHLHVAGGDAREALHHYDSKMTREVYIDPTIAKPEAACDKLFRLNEPPKRDPDDLRLKEDDDAA